MTEKRIGAVTISGLTVGTDTKGLFVYRYQAGDRSSPLDEVQYETRYTILKKPSGEVVFDNTPDGGFKVPVSWSTLAGDIAAEKYGRKAGCSLLPGGRESSVQHIISRVAAKIRMVGMEQGYFLSKENALNFQAELENLCVNQYGAFNSPVWFNCGLDLYGCKGSGGNFYWEPARDRSAMLLPLAEECVVQTTDAYTRPQCSACFILKREDTTDSIFQGVKDEARLFKYGSGAGSNVSAWRSKYELLSGGGRSSGLISFLRVYDVGAGSLKSGGTTRRAAKMVVLNDDHPEVFDFVKWKSGEEKKAKILEAAGYSGGMEGEAYLTVSGQNSNNSICFSDQFMYELSQGTQGLWSTRLVTTGAIHQTFPAADLWRAVAVNTWECGDPGVHFGGTINAWHTCPNSGPIVASNPCSEYLFLDDTACNLASLNLLKYVKIRNPVAPPTPDYQGYPQLETYFDIELFQHHCRILFIAQEILVGASSYPTAAVAENSYKYRPLGLGHCNGGLMLMTLGIPYDSDEGRALMGAITSLMTATAYHTSTMLAQVKGPFEGYEANKVPFMAVMEKHRQAHWNLPTPYAVNAELLTSIRKAGYDAWEAVIRDGGQYGFRNAQATVLAPTGTIGFLMGAETTGLEPLYSIVMTKKYAGGSSRKIVCEGAMEAIRVIAALCNGDPNHRGFVDVDAIIEYILASGHVQGSGLPEKYWPIFATAGGQRNVIDWKAHIDMMEAVQPFLSGAISKTVNMPEESSVEDIERAYLAAYQKGLKAVAIYRDNSKGNQPLNTEKKVVPPYIDDNGDISAVKVETSNGPYIVSTGRYVSGVDTGAPGGDKTVFTVVNGNEHHVGHVSEERLIDHMSQPTAYQSQIGRWVVPLEVLGFNTDMGVVEMRPYGALESNLEDRNSPQTHRYGVSLDSVRSYVLDHNPRYIKEMDQGTLDALEIPPLSPHLAEFFAPLGITKPMIEVLGISTSAQGLMEHLLGIKKPAEPTRHKMRDKAKCDIYRPVIGGQRFYIHVGLDDSGRPLEVFLRGLKMGGATLALLDAWCVAVSCALQYGMPLSEVVDKFTFLKFEPAGGVQHHSSIKMCSSIIDLIARILGYEYLGMKDLGHVEVEEPTLAAAFKETNAPPPFYNAIPDVTAAKETKKLTNPVLNHNAPLCDVCGHITQPNGRCHRCPNCGHSMGCS